MNVDSTKLRDDKLLEAFQKDLRDTINIEYQKKYKRLRKTAKTMTEQRQVEYWDEVCEDIEKSIKNNDPTNSVFHHKTSQGRK